MEPAIGASTCALGSHRCIPYRGIFTRNASRHPAHHILSAVERSGKAGAYWRVRSERVPVVFWRSNRATSRGREPARV